MSKFVKGLLEKELTKSFEGLESCLVVSLRGVRGTDTNRLRGDLLSKGIQVRMVKNSLARRAFADLGMEGLKDILVGSTSIAYGGESIVDLAKVIVAWGKELEPLEIKGALVEGSVLDAEAAKALSKMPTRVELQGQVVMLAMSPGAKIASVLMSPAGTIAGCVKSVIEKLESGSQAEAA